MKQRLLNGLKSLVPILCLLPSAAPAQEMVKLLPDKFNEYALNYYLPNTVVDIEIVATKTTYKSGPYYKYAKKYLGVSDAVTEDSEVWDIEQVCLTPRGVADTENRYQLTFKAGQTPYIYVNTENVISAINTEPELPASDCPEVKPDEISQIDVKKVYSEELLMSGSIAKMAEVAAKQIYRIRESRLNLLTGDVDKMPADGDSFKLVISQLDEQEAALTALFLGTKSVERSVKHFTYAPEGDVDRSILCRFSDFLGFVETDNLSGAPIYLSVEVTERGEYPVDDKGRVKKVPKGAVAYSIPGKAVLRIAYEGKTYAEEEFSIARLGVVYGLNTDLFIDKKAPVKATFDPTTGALQYMGSDK